MARPAKKPPEQWENEILDAAQNLFLSKGYEETSVSDIMQAAGGATGMFYRCYQSKEELLNGQRCIRKKQHVCCVIPKSLSAANSPLF